MENLKNMFTSANFISNLIMNAILFTIIYIIISRYKTREKFYHAVLSGSYLDLLGFLMITKESAQKVILGQHYPTYLSNIKFGLYNYFNERLDVRVTSSRIARIKESFDLARNEVTKKSSHLEDNESYWGTINEQLKRVIFVCGPAYFASCYIQSLDEKENEEKEARSFLLNYYNECANSQDEERQRQFDTFVDLVNQEIDKYQKYTNVPLERKHFLLNSKLIVNKNVITSTEVRATAG